MKRKLEPVAADLLKSMQQMVNDPAFSDVVVFVCKDGEKVPASRRVVSSGGSPVLKNLLNSGMAESTLREILLPSISSPVLRAVVEFLSTGTVTEHCPRTWPMVCEMIIGSRYFLIPEIGEDYPQVHAR